MIQEGPGNGVGTIGTPGGEQNAPKPVVGENAQHFGAGGRFVGLGSRAADSACPPLLFSTKVFWKQWHPTLQCALDSITLVKWLHLLVAFTVCEMGTVFPLGSLLSCFEDLMR